MLEEFFGRSAIYLKKKIGEECQEFVKVVNKVSGGFIDENKIWCCMISF